jgi:hypothetical protein
VLAGSASELATPSVVRRTLREGRVRTRTAAPPTLVDTDDGYVLVSRTADRAPDPHRPRGTRWA